MDLRKEMVIIDNKIVTNDILWYKYDTNNHCFILKQCLKYFIIHKITYMKYIFKQFDNVIEVYPNETE